MPHTSITPNEEGPYYAGSILNIPIHFTDGGGFDYPIQDEQWVVFRAKYDLTDDDGEAILTKDSREGGDAYDSEITVEGTFQDQALDDNECVVHIEDGDTDEAVIEEDVRLPENTIQFHCRLHDPERGHVTAVTGDWEVHAD